MKATEEIEPIINLLKEINFKLDSRRQAKKYYRNQDLKDCFGLSDNTIISYRDKNILPFSKIGEIYYYPISEIDSILQKNSNFDLFKNKLH